MGRINDSLEFASVGFTISNIRLEDEISIPKATTVFFPHAVGVCHSKLKTAKRRRGKTYQFTATQLVAILNDISTPSLRLQ